MNQVEIEFGKLVVGSAVRAMGPTLALAAKASFAPVIRESAWTMVKGVAKGMVKLVFGRR